MTLYYSDSRAAIYSGDCVEVLSTFPENKFDSIVTDPPYAVESSKDNAMLGQIAHNWHDKGSHTRGYYDNDNKEFQKWCEQWATECLRVLKPGGYILSFGGTRTFHRLTSALEDSGFEIRDCLSWIYGTGFPKGLNVEKAITKTYGEEAAEPWSDWNTTLRPSWEPIILAKKPLDGKIIDNILAVGTGALNIGATRVENNKWTPNVALDEEAVEVLEEQALKTSRYFYCSKAAKKDKPTYTKEDGSEIIHPTVKPMDLMSWLVKMVTSPDGLILDPFGGSGTTAEAALLNGFKCVTIERNEDYLPLIKSRVARAV